MSSSRSRLLPPRLAERAVAYSAGRLVPPSPRPASTVVLLRDGARGMEAYLLRRRSTMPFAPGMYAFPGGGVDRRDADHAAASWHGPSPDAWARRLGMDVDAACGFVSAAVRETFEETGVLLASSARPGQTTKDEDDRTLVPAGAGWDADRRALTEGTVALTELLARRGLGLRTDLLRPWAHWITPRFETRRYDAWFFLAALPAGQEARDVSGEADHASWVRPADADAAAESGAISMLPPTWIVLQELSQYGCVSDALNAADSRVIDPILPGWVRERGVVRTLLPTDPEYPGDDPGDDPGEQSPRAAAPGD